MAFGFQASRAPHDTIEDIEGILVHVIGDGHAAKLSTRTDQAKMGIISFLSIPIQVEFYEKCRNTQGRPNDKKKTRRSRTI
eukprot:3230601-Pyramimonas_sp.AAC.1